MKSFKQLALAAAVLSASFMAQAQMKSMEDTALSDVTCGFHGHLATHSMSI